jgi:hypothetical protein
MTGKGATMDIGAWLQELGLGQYEAAFRITRSTTQFFAT